MADIKYEMQRPTSSVNFEAWAADMCDLLDAIELALPDDPERAEKLVTGRFAIAEKHGLRKVNTGPTGGMQ
jgi:hypothetical protein